MVCDGVCCWSSDEFSIDDVYVYIYIITFILTLWQSCVLSTVALINEYDDDGQSAVC